MRLFFVVRKPPISERSFFFRENPFSYRLGNGAGFSIIARIAGSRIGSWRMTLPKEVGVCYRYYWDKGEHKI